MTQLLQRKTKYFFFYFGFIKPVSKCLIMVGLFSKFAFPFLRNVLKAEKISIFYHD